MRALDNRTPEDDFVIDALLKSLPSAALIIARTIRSIVLFGLTLALVRFVPSAVAASMTLAVTVGLLAAFNMTKWLAVAVLTVLLILVVVPPELIRALSRT